MAPSHKQSLNLLSKRFFLQTLFAAGDQGERNRRRFPSHPRIGTIRLHSLISSAKVSGFRCNSTVKQWIGKRPASQTASIFFEFEFENDSASAVLIWKLAAEANGMRQ
jgi:hypothetical protein